MIDLKILRENPEKVRENLEQRNMADFPLEELLALETKRRDLITTNQKLKERRNATSLEIAQRKRAKSDASDLLTAMKQESDQITANDKEIGEANERFQDLAKRLPNFIDPKVPIGKDDSANLEVLKWAPEKIVQPSRTREHSEIAVEFDLVDIERAAKTSGARFYFLKRDLARLNYAIMSAGLDFLRDRGFSPVQPPYMLKRDMIGGAVIFSDFEEVIYKIQDEDLYLIGTSEHALASMYSGEIFEPGHLPIRYAGVSPCFRKEAGAHGKDTKGIFRVHQFEKVEQFVFCEPENSPGEHARIVRNTHEFMQSLGIPHREVILSSGDMGKVPSITIDIEAWMPSQGKYREIVSCSNCTDFQSRSLGIKYRRKAHEESMFVHTLNGTLIATERTMVAILENYYRADARVIEIPSLLRRYMNGQEAIEYPMPKIEA